MSYSSAELVYKDNNLYLLINDVTVKLFFDIYKLNPKQIVTKIHSYCLEHETRITSINISGIPSYIKQQIISMLWLEEDIEPHISNELVNKSNNKVNVNTYLNTLQNYKKVTPKKIYNKSVSLSNILKNINIMFISSTPQGGGVALMRHAIVRLGQLLGININWHVLSPDPKIFEFTKKIHNATQNKLKNKHDIDTFLNDQDVEYYNEWIKHNFNTMEASIKKASIVIIDDPQPSGLIPLIHEIGIPMVLRVHIHLIPKLIDTEGSVQQKAFNFFNQYIKYVEKVIFHPVEEFIPYNIDKSKVIKFGAATDNLDGLNKQLSSSQLIEHLDRFNRFQETINRNKIDIDRQHIIQISRFDPSKGIPDLLRAYLDFRNRCSDLPLTSIPQLIMVGHGAVDDPDGIPILKEIDELLSGEEFKNIIDDIIISKLPHYIKEDGYNFSTDQILNALMTDSKFVLQLSHKEGYEIKITEALWHGKPVIAYNTGGIPLQLKNNINGFLIEVGDIKMVSQKIFDLNNDINLYNKIQSNCKKHCNNNFTIDNLNNWLDLISDVLKIKKENLYMILLSIASKYVKILSSKLVYYTTTLVKKFPILVRLLNQ